MMKSYKNQWFKWKIKLLSDLDVCITLKYLNIIKYKKFIIISIQLKMS